MTTHPLIPTAALAAAVLLAALPARSDAARNPFVQTIYTADPAPLVVGDTLYVYTSHDEDVLVNDFFTMRDWWVFSTRDMVNWTHHGSPLSLDDFTWANKNAWAPQCIGRNGKYYFYVPVERNNGGMAIGVAVGDSPTGPFEDPLGEPLVADGHGDIDPTVFIDDDGQAYLAWGNPTYKYVKLNEDMISYDRSVGDNGVFRHPMTVEAFGERTKDDRATSYEEGPWIHKRGDRYYLFFAGGPISEHLAYSTGPGPEGPWTYGGIVMPTQGRSFTNHPGVAGFKGRTYLFYHNGALPGGSGFHRSVCVDELKFNAEGSVVRMDMSEEGPEPVAALDPYQLVEAETIAWASGVETETCSEGGLNLTDLQDGDWVQVANVDFGDGASKFNARVAAERSGGKIELRLGAHDGELIGSVAVGRTGGPQEWANVSCPASGASGKQNLFLVFTGDGDPLFNLDCWKFE